MAYVAREVFRQDFTSTNRIIVKHDQDIDYPAVRVIIDDEARPDLISGILVDEEDPRNRLGVGLRSIQTGVVQILDYDFQPAGVQSATILALLDQGQRFNFGTEYAYNEDIATVGTNSTTFVQRLRLSVTGIPLGTYRIRCNFTWDYESTGDDALARIEVDDSIELWNMRAEPKDSGGDQKYFAEGGGTIILTPGDHDIDLDFATSNAAEGHFITNPRIEFWRV